MEDIFSPSLVSAVRIAKSMAHKDKHKTYGVAYLAMALFLEPTGLDDILRSLGKDVDYIREWFDVMRESYVSEAHDAEMIADKEVEKVFEESERSKLKLGTDYIDALCVFTAIIREGVVYDSKQLEILMLKEEEIMEHYHVKGGIGMQLDPSQSTVEDIVGINYCKNLMTADYADQGEYIIGRDKEIRQVLENLERQENSGILLTGDSGVGKTAFFKGLVYHLWNSKNPAHKDIHLVGLNTSKLLANSSNQNDLTKKLSEIFDKIAKLNNTILFIDDMHTLIDDGQNNHAVINLIASELNEGHVGLIASTTNDAYRKTIEKHALQRKLDIIKLEELAPLVLDECMENYRLKLSAYYTLQIEKEAVGDAIHYSKRYFKESKLPHEAISLLDKTLAAVKTSNQETLENVKAIAKRIEKVDTTQPDALLKLKYASKLIVNQLSPVVLAKLTENYGAEKIEDPQQLKSILERQIQALETIGAEKISVITSHEVTSLVSSLTNIPIGKIQAEEKERLLNIEEKLEERVKGQSHAIKALSDAIIESRSGLSNPNQPIGSFFFLGPTGTGKTELTKSLAALLFDDENAMIRFDMSEFKEEHSAALLYGAPPGYVGYEEGGMLVNKIRQKPYSVILFDEIEKAHASVYDVFLQLMDEGKVHDKLGREGDFSNAIIIFTSNIGSEWIAQQIDEGKIPSSNQLIEVMSNHFRPEFLGRLTEVLPFAPIREEIAQKIFILQLTRLQQQLVEQKEITLSLSDEAINYLSQKAYSKKYGARPIAGYIRTYIKKVISRMIVAQTIVAKDKVLLDYKDNTLSWEKL